MPNLSIQDRILIVGVTPYFLEKGSFWFEKNLKKILQARKTQPFWQDNTLYLEQNQHHNFYQFLRKLDELGYEKVFSVSEPGEFAQRGGIIDVFPVNSRSAYRFDFLGNRIENIKELPVKIKDEKSAREILKKKLRSQKLFSDLKGLKSGDYLVHLDHGIGRYDKQLIVNGKYYYLIEYAANDKLYVPVGLERKLSRYIGFVDPKISRLGSLVWQRTKRRIKEEVEKLAKELLEIYAKREVADRPPYLPSDEIDKQIVSGFQYEETPDQISAFEDIEKDLRKSGPMDRIVCGDVGFGKTEVALRTMIRAVKSGYQSALLCPTTILANQHFQNFRRRLEGFPVAVEMLSRIQKKREQKKIIEGLKQGSVDILIGTHRILSNDVEFKNLGLLVIDDEQKFGVKQKEKFKKMRANLDVLSLSATPIPRTLYLALSSFKDISLIQTPPLGRMAIKTYVFPYSQKIIKKAIDFELSREGQVYYLHNRVETIEKVKERLKNLAPAAKIGIVHGRLKEKDLIGIMDGFQKEKIIILVATTIIENGLDFPRVNTLIVEDSARLGLSQAYQIRGRIGRSNIQSFAYFFYSKKHISSLAEERLKALKEARDLGFGYRIAMKDLEIRGAGNVLGKEQSGNVNAVGLNLYCQILSEAVEKLKQHG